jgi:L-amino acid N-acyltransferase YncA
MTTLIRAATAADIPAITAIYGDAVRFGTASFEVAPPDETEMAERFSALVAGGFPYLVATTDAGVAGIGRALLDRLMTESEARGFRQMIAVIGDSAQAGSIALHRAAGFRMVGTLEAVGYKFGRWLDTVLMQRALGEGATTAP